MRISHCHTKEIRTKNSRAFTMLKSKGWSFCSQEDVESNSTEILVASDEPGHQSLDQNLQAVAFQRGQKYVS